MTHAVQWSALARRTGIRNRNRYSSRGLVTRWTAPGVAAAVIVRSARPGRAGSGPAARLAGRGGGEPHEPRVRGFAGERSPPSRRCHRAIEVIRAVKERSGCTGIRGRGNKKPRSGGTPAGAFASGRRAAEVFSAGLPNRCAGDLLHEFTVHGSRIGERPRTARAAGGAHRHRPREVVRLACSVRWDGRGFRQVRTLVRGGWIPASRQGRRSLLAAGRMSTGNAARAKVISRCPEVGGCWSSPLSPREGPGVRG